MRSLAFALIVSFACGSVVAFAASHSVSQKGKVFSENAVTLKKGDVLMFVNDDTVAHNILSVTPGNEFNLGSQAPGESTPVTFSSPGEVAVVCAIHPRMKMTVTVTP